MRSYTDCVHCYLKQAVSCMQLGGVDEDRQHEILYELMDIIKGFDRDRSPAWNSSVAVKKTYELMGVADPYHEAKMESNDLALKLYPELEEMVDRSGDRLHTALKISVSGNVIDLGINRSYDVHEGLRHSIEQGFSIDRYEDFKKRLQNTQDILILGDNSGEIVFDRILVRELRDMGKKITYAVKEGPVLNDATLEDAVYVGMDRLAEAVTNGTDMLGTNMEAVSDEFRQIYYRTPVIISKGQANFETLEAEPSAADRVFFMLKIKCVDVGRVAGADYGTYVFFNRCSSKDDISVTG